MTVVKADSLPLSTSVGSQTGSATAWLLTLGVLTSTFNFIDRSVLNILAEPIKQDLGLTDSELGLLTGLSFALFYALVGIPIARYVDRPRTRRPYVVGACIACWSAATAVCGLASGYLQLLIARVFVGVGEGGSGPALLTLINDTVPTGKRAWAYAIYGLGGSFGTFGGLAIGGLLADAVGWRMTFIFVGAPGLLLAVVVAKFIREPRLTRPVHEVHVHASLMDAFRAISGSSALIWLIAAGTAATILALGTTTWIAVFTIRNLGLAPTEAGLLVGLLMGGASVVGNLAGGFAADRLGKKRIRSVMLVPAVGSALAVPFAVAAFMADRPMSFALLYFIPAAAGLLWSPPFLHLIQRLSPAPVRATVTQMGVVVMSLVGLGLGPLLVGIGSDLLADTHGVESLRYALIAASFWGLVTAAILWRSGCLAERSLLTNPEA